MEHKEVETNEKPLDRLNFLENIAGVLAFLPFLSIAACNNGSTSKTSSKKSSDSDETIVGEDKNNGDQSTNSDAAAACPDLPPNTADLASIPSEIPEALKPELYAYGSPKKCSLVVSFPKYGHGGPVEVASFVIARFTGSLVALKVIMRSDIAADNKIIPVVLDNLPVSKGDKVCIIVQTTDGNQYKHQIEAPISFQDPYLKSETYVDLSLASDITIPDGVQPIINFYPTNPRSLGANPSDDQIKEIWDRGDYFIAGSTSQYSTSPGLTDFIITDLTGTILSQQGETFNDLLNHTEVICYKNMGGTWYRTMIRLG